MKIDMKFIRNCADLVYQIESFTDANMYLFHNALEIYYCIKYQYGDYEANFFLQSESIAITSSLFNFKDKFT